MENPLNLQCHEMLTDRLFLKDFHKSALQTASVGESGVYILEREMDVLAFRSNHCIKFLPSKEF